MQVEEIRRRALRALMPPPSIAMAEWLEQNIHIPSTASSTPGRMRLWPHQRGIVDALDDPAIEKITVIKSARVGWTQLLSGIIASYCANSPCPILAVQPTADDARGYAVELESLFEASPALRGILTDADDDNGRSTILHRMFPGGSIRFVAARSPRTLRRYGVQVAILDEIDAYENTAEGDVIELATMRTQTYRNRRILAGGTPIYDHGPVTRLYAQSDQRVYEVCCPSCSEYSEVRWADIRWNPDDPESAHWVCPDNGCVVEERHKPSMVAAGRWRATAPEVKGHAGFRINALVSPHHNARWSKLVEEFLKAKDSPELLQPWTNLVLGEPWRAEGDELDEHELAARAEDFGLTMIPEDVLVLTAGVDVQHDRFEATYLGHCADGTALVLGHKVVWGNVLDDAEPWQELDELLSARFPHALGGRGMALDAVFIDSGDGATTHLVYNFAAPRTRKKILAIKGASGTARQIIERSRAKTKTGARRDLIIVGVDSAKTQIFARLAKPGSIRFSADLPAVWFEQATSERAVIRYSRGRPTRSFEPIPGKGRQEGLDCLVYAFAARQIVNVDPERRRQELASDQPRRRAAGPVLQSSWMKR